jgi:hypothetical protein
MTALERAIERHKAERVARGLPELIESPAVFRLLDAVLAQQAEQEHAPGATYARYSTKEHRPEK